MQQAYHQSSRFKTQADKKAQGKAKKKKKKSRQCMPAKSWDIGARDFNEFGLNWELVMSWSVPHRASSRWQSSGSF